MKKIADITFNPIQLFLSVIEEKFKVFNVTHYEDLDEIFIENEKKLYSLSLSAYLGTYHVLDRNIPCRFSISDSDSDSIASVYFNIYQELFDDESFIETLKDLLNETDFFDQVIVEFLKTSDRDNVVKKLTDFLAERIFQKFESTKFKTSGYD